MMTWNVVVLGGSPAGLNIALALMVPGFSTVIVEPDLDAAERVAAFLSRLSGAGVCLPVVTSEAAALGRADIVFDASEDDPPDGWQSLCAALPDRVLVMATDPGAPTGAAERIGFHLFAPSHLRKLVEIIPVLETPDVKVQAVVDLARDMGRVPVLAPDDRPSIGTRLQRRLYETADRLLLHGAIPHELDEAMVDFGFDIGVYQAQDLIGLDVAYADRKRCAATRDPARPYVLISDRMVEEGRLGKKVGVGWYRYPGGGGAVIDPLIEDLIREEARFAGIEPQVFSAPEMMDRLLQALTDEGSAMLADGTATDAAQIDAVSVHGLGFPAALGGVMCYAEEQR